MLNVTNLSTLSSCLDTFVTKASFYHFFLHQTQSKCDGNVHEKALKKNVIYPKSGFGRAGASGPSTREVGCVSGLAASYIQKSTDSDSALLSARLRISSDSNRLGPDAFSLINPQQSV